MYSKSLFVIFTFSSLAACGGSTTINEILPIDTPQFGQANVNANGSIDGILEDTLVGNNILADGDGFSFVVGTYPDQSTVGGFGGLTPSTNLTGAIPMADFDMSGPYRLARLTDLTRENGDIVRTPTEVVGEISLVVDVDNASISGTHNDLQVLGSFDGNTLEGTVIYRGVSGNLDGQISGDRSVATFAGGNADSVYAGGFLVND